MVVQPSMVLSVKLRSTLRSGRLCFFLVVNGKEEKKGVVKFDYG